MSDIDLSRLFLYIESVMTRNLLDDPRITTFGRLVEAYAALTDVLGRELEREVGLPLLWLGVMLHIARSPQGVRPLGELMNATAFTSGGVTRLVDRMEAVGYVERRKCPSDRRVQFVALTPQGEALLERALPVHLRGIQEHLLDGLSPAEAETLSALLGRVAAVQRRADPL